MIDIFFTILPLAAGIGVLIYTVANYERLSYQAGRPGADSLLDLPERLTVRELGRVERYLADLSRVIVVADQVERPTDELSEAVERNFERGVKYLFLVSQSRAQDEVNGYYQIFEALARIVVSRSGTMQVKDLVDIQQLPYDWDDYPYIFYLVHSEAAMPKIVAFRGEQVHEGIADYYIRVDPSYAHTIARSVLADSPEPIKSVITVDRGQFEKTGGHLRLVRNVASQSGRRTG